MAIVKWISILETWKMLLGCLRGASQWGPLSLQTRQGCHRRVSCEPARGSRGAKWLCHPQSLTQTEILVSYFDIAICVILSQ